MEQVKQTSIEWVLQYLNNVKPNEFCSIEKIKEVLEQAKEMEKEQIKNAYVKGQSDCEIFTMESESEQYYNETYEGNK